MRASRLSSLRSWREFSVVVDRTARAKKSIVVILFGGLCRLTRIALVRLGGVRDGTQVIDAM